MNSIKLQLSKTRMILLIVNYLIAVFGGYRLIASLLINKISSSTNNIELIIRVLLYCFIIILNIFIGFPLIRDSIKNFKLKSIDGLFSIFFIMSLALLVLVLFKIFFGLNMTSNQIKNQNTFEMSIWYSAFVALIYAPIVEEIVFRGGVYMIGKIYLGRTISIIISSMLFALLHIMSSNGSIGFSFTDMIYLCVYFIMGITFCISFEYSNSIVGAMFNHFLWNFGTFSIMLIRHYF